MVERNCVDTPTSAGCFCSLRINSSVCRSSIDRPRPPRSSTMSLNPPATLSPGMGGAPKASTCASLTCRAHCGRNRAMMASSLSSGSFRWENGSRVMNIEPKFEPLAPCTKEKPATVSVCATPLVLRAISSTFAKAALVRSSDAASGSCTPTMIRPWSCCGTNPRGAALNVV